MIMGDQLLSCRHGTKATRCYQSNGTTARCSGLAKRPRIRWGTTVTHEQQWPGRITKPSLEVLTSNNERNMAKIKDHSHCSIEASTEPFYLVPNGEMHATKQSQTTNRHATSKQSARYDCPSSNWQTFKLGCETPPSDRWSTIGTSRLNQFANERHQHRSNTREVNSRLLITNAATATPPAFSQQRTLPHPWHDWDGVSPWTEPRSSDTCSGSQSPRDQR